MVEAASQPQLTTLTPEEIKPHSWLDTWLPRMEVVLLSSSFNWGWPGLYLLASDII